MARLMKGEVATRLETWRTSLKMVVYAKHRGVVGAMVSQMQAQGQFGAVRQMRLVWTRLTKDKTAARVGLWRSGTVKATQARLHETLRAQMRAQRQDEALQQLKQITTRLMKGEVAMRTMTWQSAMKDERKRLVQGELSCALEQQIQLLKHMRDSNSQLHAAGLCRVREILARIHQQEAQAKVCAWRKAAQDGRMRQLYMGSPRAPGGTMDAACSCVVCACMATLKECMHGLDKCGQRMTPHGPLRALQGVVAEQAKHIRTALHAQDELQQWLLASSSPPPGPRFPRLELLAPQQVSSLAGKVSTSGQPCFSCMSEVLLRLSL